MEEATLLRSCLGDDLNSQERLEITVHILGSKGSGRRTLTKQWLDSSVSAVLGRFADVQLRVEDGVGADALSSLNDPVWISSSVFLVMYRTGQQQSICYAKQCLRTLFASFPTNTPPIVLVENTDSPSFSAGPQHPFETSNREFDEYNISFFVVNVTKPVQLPAVFEHAVVRPLLDPLDEQATQKITDMACRSGHCSTLKLLVSIGKQPRPQQWIVMVLKRLSELMITNQALSPLLDTAEFIYHLDKQSCLNLLLTQLPHMPKACLLTFNRLSDPTNRNTQQLLLDHMNIGTLPPQGVADAPFTQISLAHNGLSAIPEELMQLPLLTTLNISHNNLDQLPSILRWNCPRLRELNVAHNKLTDTSEKLLKRMGSPSTPQHSSSSSDRHTRPQQKLLQLTGHNLYSCIYSLTSVNLSHNCKITKLADWVCVLPNLVMLNLQGLPKLKQLPQQLALWNNLAIIKLDPEKMSSPPPSVCQQGSQAIMAYLRCQLRGSMHYRHMKLMLLGGTGVGKSTTFKQLLSERSNTRQQLSSMDIASFNYRPPSKSGKSVKVTYHLIDFAEHSQTPFVYKCFLTQRCIYLCLWDVTDGRKGMASLLPWLHCIHSTVSSATVVLVGTHADKNPDLTSETVLQWQKEVFLSSSHSYSHGLPQVARCVVINALNQQDIEMLKREVYTVTMELTSPYSSKPLMEEQVPRSYIELQGLVETKVKHLQQRAHVMSYEEFIDSFHAVSLHSWDLAYDEEEFALACQFLHETGVIVHHRSSRLDQSGLFFLCPQWLSDSLSTILKICSKKIGKGGGGGGEAVFLLSELQLILEEAGVPVQHHKQFSHMLEQYNIIVALDMDRKQFLIPSLLPPDQPSSYPTYDLSSNVLVQCTSFLYMPDPVFQQLQTRILLHLHQLGAQLITLVPELPEHSRKDSTHPSQLQKKVLKVDHKSYIFQENTTSMEEHSFKTVCRLLRALSITNTDDQPDLRDDLHTQINALSHPFVVHLPSFSEDATATWVSTDQFSRCQIWERGMYIESLCGTKAWVEVFKSGVAMVSCGAELARVKTLMFLSHCLDTVVEECYPLLTPTVYSPCPSCLSSMGSFSFLSQELQIEPQSCYSARGPTLSCAADESSAPTSDPNHPMASFRQQMYLFPATALIQQSQGGPVPTCPRCSRHPSLNIITPHILLTDFSNELQLLQPELLVFSQTEQSRLGRGSYAEVYQGTYNEMDVAVKVFHVRERIPPDITIPFKALRRELTILSNVRHPLIHPALGALLHPWSIVFELAPLGSLRDHLNLCPCGLEEQTSHQLLYQIASGLEYLHSLCIIHRDVKPSNVLVWSLHPTSGVRIRITDCGLSQFSIPCGLRVAIGTEEYMAPELLRSSRNSSYNEKVDIFSFGVLLHFVVTGSKPMPSILHQQSSLLHSMNLSKAIATALDEHRPRAMRENAASAILVDGQHPAARENKVTLCVTACMQPILQDCLSPAPRDRPSASSISHRLLLCTGPLPQDKMVLHGHSHISQAHLSQEAGCIVAQLNNSRELTTLTLGLWAPKTSFLPLMEQETPMITVTGRLLVVATRMEQTLSVYRLPELSEAEELPARLPFPPSHIFSYQDSANNSMVAVGAQGGYISVYCVSEQLTLGLPHSEQIFYNQDSKKSAVTAGVYYQESLLCGCGRYLIGVDAKTLEQKYIRLLSKRQSDKVTDMVASEGKLWTMIATSSEVVVCSTRNGNLLTTIDCKSLLVQGGIPLVSLVMAGPQMVWVGTQTGYLLGFDPQDLQLVVVACRHSCVDSVVCAGGGVMVVFGRWVFESSTLSGFTIWQSHVNMMSL